MPTQPFTLADLRTVADALYGRQWQAHFARDLKITPRTIGRWFDGSAVLPDLRHYLADLCRQKGADDPNMEKLARKLEELGPPER